MLQTLDQRLETLARFGLDAVCVQSFKSEFASLLPGEFVREVLVRSFGARIVVVGPDFRFGRGRRGGVGELERLGGRGGLDIRVVPPVKRRGDCVSSSAIRELLAAGRVERAGAFLGRPYAIEGDVVAGEGRGRLLGYPTANISTPNEIVPPGVFATAIEIGGRGYPSVTNAGTRPTFGTGSAATIEAHVLGLRRSLYGESVRLRFLKKIRGERRFADSSGLKARIRTDAEAARRFFAGRPDVV
jgi:riboflavin kinase/FMN adenylyltransferase